jgi:uncharacterized protein (TIGR03083 family)
METAIRLPATMPLDLAVAYAQTHRSLTALVRELDRSALATQVPATPDWSVRDVVAHVTGVALDAVRGEGWEVYGVIVDRSALGRLDERTAEQVDARRDVPFDAVLDEWAGLVAELAPVLRGERLGPARAPFADRMLATDLATHAQDVRGALAMPGDRDSMGVSAAFSSYAGGLHLRLSGSGLPALRIVYGEKDRVLGDGEPGAAVAADRFELYRAMAGRRSRRQILAYTWTGDPEPYVPMIPAYGERLTDLVE